MRHSSAKMFGQRIGLEPRAVHRGVDDRNILSNFRVIDPEGNRIEQRLESARVLFNFGRTNSETAGLNHRIHPAKEIEVALFIALYEVTGKNEGLVRETINLSKSFRGGFGRVPVSLGYAATTVNQLARNARRTVTPLFVEDVKLDFGNCLADRSRPNSDLL